jgi:hypothetical protein
MFGNYQDIKCVFETQIDEQHQKSDCLEAVGRVAASIYAKVLCDGLDTDVKSSTVPSHFATANAARSEQ